MKFVNYIICVVFICTISATKLSEGLYKFSEESLNTNFVNEKNNDPGHDDIIENQMNLDGEIYYIKNNGDEVPGGYNGKVFAKKKKTVLTRVRNRGISIIRIEYRLDELPQVNGNVVKPYFESTDEGLKPIYEFGTILEVERGSNRYRVYRIDLIYIRDKDGMEIKKEVIDTNHVHGHVCDPRLGCQN